MQYVTARFGNTRAGLAQKDAYSRQMAADGYHIVSEQLEAGHYKGGEQCCLFSLCAPCVFLAGRTPGLVVVTYGREVFSCPNCGAEILAGTQCSNCLRIASERAGWANARNAEANKSNKKLETLLVDGIAGDYRFNWPSLVKPYPVAAPGLGPEPAPKRTPLVVRASRAVPALEKIPWCRTRRLKWEESLQSDARNRAVVVEQYNHDFENWKQSKNSFDREQHTQVEEKCRLYESKDRDTLLEYWGRILEQSIYGSQSNPVRSMAFLESQGKLIVSYAPPPIGELPKIEEVRYAQPENAVTEIHFSAERLRGLYRDLIIKIALVAIYRLFQSDTASALNSVALNGTIDKIDKATGREVSPCVITVQADKSRFMDMNFSLVDTVACFEGLGGRISEDLTEFSPIAPIAE